MGWNDPETKGVKRRGLDVAVGHVGQMMLESRSPPLAPGAAECQGALGRL